MRKKGSLQELKIWHLNLSFDYYTYGKLNQPMHIFAGTAAF